MDIETIAIMARTAEIELNTDYCPFNNSSKCRVKLGLCNTLLYEGCANYNARVIEVWRERVRGKSKQEKEEQLITA